MCLQVCVDSVGYGGTGWCSVRLPKPRPYVCISQRFYFDLVLGLRVCWSLSQVMQQHLYPRKKHLAHLGFVVAAREQGTPKALQKHLAGEIRLKLGGMKKRQQQRLQLDFSSFWLIISFSHQAC